MRLAIVTNIPAPYRVPVYNRIAAEPGVELLVVYAAQSEPDRKWDLPQFEHIHTFLPAHMFERAGRYIHYSPGAWRALTRFRPDVVLSTGYNPMHLAAWLWARLHRRPHVVMTDGTERSETGLSRLHRLVRRAVFATSASFVAASQGGWRLLRGYGVRDARIHFSPLCANTAVDWASSAGAQRDVDILFSGRLVPVKNASFVIDMARDVATRLGRPVSLVLLGSGPQESALRQQAAALAGQVEATFAGHVAQADLPKWFHRARLFAFPTLWDPWGVVANEAIVAGVPVLVSPHAGVAGELIRDRVTGRVLPLEQAAWADAAAELLSNAALRAQLSTAARAAAQPYSFENAAQGIVDAARQARAPHPASPRHSSFVRRRRVVCVQRRLPQYRVPLFVALRQELARRDIDFVLVHGQATAAEADKRDEGHLPWALQVPCRYALGGRLCWQSLGPALATADLAIVTQENRLLHNLLALTWRRPTRLAFWGHGRNFQSAGASDGREWFKNWTSRHADWWFAYTDLSSAVVQASGFTAARITTVNNAIDTSALMAECAAVDESAIAAWRARLNLGTGPVGVFIGSLYEEKRIGLLLRAGGELARRVPGFRLVVIGDGPDRVLVRDAAAREGWLRHLGVQLGADKAVALRAAHLLLNPGGVGLGILDAFAAGVPLVTTDCGLHGPEIAYLRNGENALMTANSLDSFVNGCEQLLRDPAERERMAVQARCDAQRYTLQNMVQRFANGVEAALQLPAR